MVGRKLPPRISSQMCWQDPVLFCHIMRGCCRRCYSGAAASVSMAAELHPGANNIHACACSRCPAGIVSPFALQSSEDAARLGLARPGTASSCSRPSEAALPAAPHQPCPLPLTFSQAILSLKLALGFERMSILYLSPNSLTK